MSRLVQLPQFSYTELDFDTIVEDVQRLIREHPEYNNTWDDFLESNAGRMFVEITSYVVEKLVSRVDWVAQEMFISTATQRKSLLNILKLINYRPSLPKAAKVSVKAKLTKWVAPFNLPLRETLLAPDINGSLVPFELLVILDDGKPDYDYFFTLETGTSTKEIFDIPFYQGTTTTETDIRMEGIDNETYILTGSPVIEDSIRVWSIDRGAELPEVDSFIDPDAQQADIENNDDKLHPYIVEIDHENKATLVFGPSSLVKIAERDEQIQVTYRVGGGANTNIVANAMNETKTYNLGENQRVTVIYTNPNAGTGGADEERLEDAKLTAPLSLRSANKTVTHEDYISHLEDHYLVMHANIVGKENEPDEIFIEYGYHLPSLDSWIYICPERENWDTSDPATYNKILLVSRPYDRHKEIDYEDIFFDATVQSDHLTKFRKYKGFNLYVTLHGTTAEETPDPDPITDPDYRWLTGDSYIEDTDYTLNSVTGEIARISTAGGGRIPAGDAYLRVRYVYDELIDHKLKTVIDFGSVDPQNLGKVYTGDNVIVMSADGATIYEEGIDYEIAYDTTTGEITIVPTGSIFSTEKVVVYYSNNWVQDENDLSEEKEILDSISDKKMICVDNYLKDCVYTTFDIVATVYCYKNLRKGVIDGLEDYLKPYYTLDKRDFDEDLIKSDIISRIMSFDGVRYVEVEYLGKNYEAYKRYILEFIDLNELNQYDANKAEHKIEAKYNETIIMSDDEYDGIELIENKVHGMTFTYLDAPTT